MSAPNGVFAPSRIAAVRGLAIPRQVFVFRCQTALIADLLPAPPAGVTSVVKSKRLACNPFVKPFTQSSILRAFRHQHLVSLCG